jgi:hypothetical protein
MVCQFLVLKMILSSLNLVRKIGVCITSEENGESKLTSEEIVIYIISGIKAILQDSSVKIADDEGVSPSSSVITGVSCNML